jgi:hypothetical protein
MRALENYLARARARLRAASLARWAASVGVGVVVVTALGTVLAMWLVPAAQTLTGLRIAMLAAVAAAFVWALRRPWDTRRVAALVEARGPTFGGRLATWVDGRRRGDDSPVFALLERQTEGIAERYPPVTLVPLREIVLPALLATAALVLLALPFFGSQPWQLAAQRVLAGDLLSGTQPRIAVSPGDTVIRRGSDLVIRAEARGFLPDELEIHAAFGAGPWERATMSATMSGTSSAAGGGAHSFVLVGVTEPVEYYVTGRGVNSGRYRVGVADLPTVTRVETRYRFPDWTGRPEQQRNGGDVAALPGTRIGVRATTDVSVDEAVLVLGDDVASMAPADSADAPVLEGSFDVTAPDSWYVAVPHQGQLARISDTYLIDVVEDAAPEIAYVWPGHDRKATPIEEVAVEFEATDDFGVESVTLNYAVNGGSWQRVELGDNGAHLLSLESLTTPEDDDQRPLRPGDVIALYAEARDHSQTSRSSLYFVDVRPFDMRYRESQQMGGQGGAEGGGLDIAERQRDILTATWNLINAPVDKSADAIADEADVLAMLQQTLQQQVQTLVTRAAARGLGGDDEVSTFIDSLSRAAEHMTPAAERLAEQAFEAAVGPEQQALRHLLTAESSVRDVDVSLSRSDARGTSGRALGELMELEMDPERNRYEMPQQASLQEQAAAGDDEAWRELDELAARQERLARRQAQERSTLPSEWEQARLRRELEALRQALASNGGGRSADSDSSASARNRASEQLERASEALDRAADGDPQGDRRAAAAMRQAADTLRRSDRGDLESRLTRADRQVENLRADQSRVMEALEALQRDSLDRARDGEGLRSDFTMQTFADTKLRMQDDLARLRGDLTGLGAALDEMNPESARAIDQALDELDEVRLDERLAASAQAFEMGQPLYVIGSESLVERALGRLGSRLDQARRALTADDAEAPDAGSRLRQLRQRLAQATSSDGVDRAAVETVVRELGRLDREVASEGAEARAGGASGAARSGRVSGSRYGIRGTAAENDAALLRLAEERLDLLEAALRMRDGVPVRAQQPRQAERDSAAAARYFRSLGRGADVDEEAR